MKLLSMMSEVIFQVIISLSFPSSGGFHGPQKGELLFMDWVKGSQRKLARRLSAASSSFPFSAWFHSFGGSSPATCRGNSTKLPMPEWGGAHFPSAFLSESSRPGSPRKFSSAASCQRLISRFGFAYGQSAAGTGIRHPNGAMFFW